MQNGKVLNAKLNNGIFFKYSGLLSAMNSQQSDID